MSATLTWNRRALAAGLDYGARAAASLLFALPLVSLVSGSGIGRFPAGDRLLFEPGGLVASELARIALPALPAVLSTSLVTFVVLSALLIVPHAAVLATLANSSKFEARAIGARAFASIPALLFVTGVALLAQVLVVGLSLVFGQALRQPWSGESPRSADLVFLAVLVLGALGALGIGVGRDLARARVVAAESDGRSALAWALRSLLRRPLAAIGAFSLRLLLGGACIALAAVLTGTLDVGEPDAYRLPLVAFIHQTTAVALAALRVSWFGATLALAGGDSAGDSAAPDVTAAAPNAG